MIALVGCEAVTKKEPNEFKPINEVTVSGEVSHVFNTTEDIEVIRLALESAVEIPGILNVTPSNLLLTLTFEDGSAEEISLWLADDDSRGMVMFLNDTHKGYNVSSTHKASLLKLIFGS